MGPAYACVQILAAAITRAGSADREKVRDAIAAADLVTVIGPCEVPARRHRHRAGQLRTVAERQARARLAEGVRDGAAGVSRAAVRQALSPSRQSPGDVPLLEVAHVCKSFGGVRAVGDVSFTLAEGEIVGVMGPNGSGKTTLFNLIAGASDPDARPDSASTARHRAGSRRTEVCKQGIARTFQLVRAVRRALRRARTCWSAGSTAATRARSAARRRPRPTVCSRWSACRRRRDVPARQLTLHRSQAAGAGAGAGHRAALLLLDEFMAGLNPTETAEAMDLIRPHPRTRGHRASWSSTSSGRCWTSRIASSC